jgi:hypothetical protein
MKTDIKKVTTLNFTKQLLIIVNGLNGEEVSDTALEDIKEYLGNRELKKKI